MTNELINKISAYDYISFDVFDTLLFRTTGHYTDVFDVVEMLYNERYGAHLKRFKKERILAESQARSSMQGKEVTLDMIYSFLSYDSQVLEKIKNIEVDCEIKNCVPNQPMLDVLKDCKVRGKKIVITTDMYLPRHYFLAVFQKLGISFDYLFISGEEGVTKRSGKLFQVVLDKLHITSNQIVHIGDDLNNDILQPQKYGIKALERILPSHVNLPYCRQKQKDMMKGLFDTFLQLGLNNYGEAKPEFILGYTIMGPMLWDFCQWLHQMKSERNLDRLLFVAREGFLVQKCYELMYPEEKDSVDYIRINKNLLRLPMLDADDLVERFVMSIPGRIQLKWIDVLSYMAFENMDEVLKSLSQMFPQLDVDVSISLKSIKAGTYNNELAYLLSLQKDKIQEQKKLLLEYLKVNGFIDKRIGLVNNSINGSGQTLIEDFLKQNNLGCDILGLQFVKSEKCIQRLGDRCEAWLLYRNISGWELSRFTAMSLILEHLMFEPQGTARFFSISENKEIVPICEEPRTEVHDFEKIAELQRYTCQFVCEYKLNMNRSLTGIGLQRYLSFLLHPTASDAKFVCNLWDDDIEEDKQITDCSHPFKMKYCLLKDLPCNTAWIEGWFSVLGVSEVFKKLTCWRMQVRYYKNHFGL